MNDHEKYALSRQAQKDGGPCPICAWRDGDGVGTCFYSPVFGIVTHQNSEKGVMATMSPTQRHLYHLRQFLAYISEEVREKELALVARDHHEYVLRMEREHPDRPPTLDEHGNPISEEEWIARYRAQQEEKPLATDPRYATWFVEPWWRPVERQGSGPIPEELRGPIKGSGGYLDSVFTAYMVHLYEPHSCGRGHQYQKEPYWLACTGCTVEIKLWEHGVDYDMG